MISLSSRLHNPWFSNHLIKKPLISFPPYVINERIEGESLSLSHNRFSSFYSSYVSFP
ncbi:hypothetical protein GIB67_034251 [Kingdonia uniflora]|uniref:Uncharacterized protein n=1 Tax=Kingdonia uniflora TaxID=39325 RepID=A0A7J7NRR5_9MAGN|nr:hypothetical protein GIB67_034251 [Kingdonia uniflora]